MALAEDIAFTGQLLDAYAVDAWRKSVATSEASDRGVPLEMQVGEVDGDGWVEWRVLPSTLTSASVDALEAEFDIQFPPLFRAYLMARFHLLDQVQSRRYEQQILMTDTPWGRPLKPLRDLLKSWRPLTGAGFIPFAQWGDGWGPMCFDFLQRSADGECPIIWIDHEALAPFGPEQLLQREAVLHMVQPLYNSSREFLLDVFSRE